MRTNKEIRKAIFEADITMWVLADKLNIRPESLSRKLRYELSNDERNRILALISELSQGSTEQ